MFLCACGLVAVSLTGSLAGLVVQIAVMLAVAVALRRAMPLLASWRTVAWVSLSLLVVYSWAYPGSTTYVWIFGVQSFFAGLLIAVRLLGFVTVMYGLLVATGPLAIVEWAGDVNEDLGIMVSLSLSVVPVMKQQMDATMEAQLARGLNVNGNLVVKVRAYIAVLIPVVVKSLVRAYGMAALLHVRGYGSGRRVRGERVTTASVVAAYVIGIAWIAGSIALRLAVRP
jgi:energy-coupling factor transporter transmembrane protein EcfT